MQLWPSLRLVLLLLCCLLPYASLAYSWDKAAPIPVVMWHGMGDTCCNPQSMGYIQKLIEQHVPGVYVHSIMLGSNEDDDQMDGFFANMNVQLDKVCHQLASDPKLAGGFNAIGFSQGSQFLRAYVERCNNPPVFNLISVGGQHQGVYGLPHCPGINYTLCEYIRELLDLGAYLSFVQDSLVQAQYWHDPLAEQEYLSNCIFLPDINNALPQKNATYKQHIMSLKNFVMVKFLRDSMVQPIESEWFGFYKEGQDVQIVPLRQSKLYLEDWLGLRALDARGALKELSVDGDHLHFTTVWLIQNIIPYFQ